MWDIEKIIDSGYTRTAPWEDDKFVQTFFRHWTYLWFIPRFVHRYKVEEFRAITFDVSKRVKDTIKDICMRDVETWEQIYFESASHSAIPVVKWNFEEIDISVACQKILWMNPPFITRKFPEGHKDVFDRPLVTESTLAYAPAWRITE